MKRILFIIVLVIMLHAMSACSYSGNTSTWQEQYNLGVRYLSGGNYEEAIIAFTVAIEIDPKQAPTYVGLADAYISVGDYVKAGEAIAQGRATCSDNEAFDRILNNLSFLQSGESGIQITSFYFDRDEYLGGKETDFLVSVAYRCPEDEECILMIGANTKEPDFFAVMDEDYKVTGSGGYQFHVSITPVQWEESYFGIYVNLSAANHAETWIPFAWDNLYIDSEGHIFEVSGAEDNSLVEQEAERQEQTRYERDHILYEELSLSDQELVSHITELLSNENEEGLYAVLENNPDIDLGYIDCGDYRLYIVSSHEMDKGDERYYLTLELRTENATGYSVHLYSDYTIDPSQREWVAFPSGWEYYYDTEWTTFQCRGWQLGNGKIVSRTNNPTKWCEYDKQDFHVVYSEETYDVTVVSGVYTGKESGDIYQYEWKYNHDRTIEDNSNNEDRVVTGTRTYDAKGILIAVNGEEYDGNVVYLDRQIFEDW